MATITIPLGAAVPGEHVDPGDWEERDARNEDERVTLGRLNIAAGRGWRAVSSATTLTGNQVSNVSDASQAALVNAKLTPGAPEYVDNLLVGTQPATTDEIRQPYVEQRFNTRGDATPNFTGVLTQPRAGSTSLDPTRPSVATHTGVVRPFGQFDQPVLDPLARPFYPAPLASQSVEFATPVADAYPSATGYAATTGSGAGTGVGTLPNTVRYLPNEWDATLTQEIGPVDIAAAVADRGRAAGWRLA